MSDFENETAIRATGDGVWSTRLSNDWNIGDICNGGYALIPSLRAMAEIAEQPHPITVTTHFLRPSFGDIDGIVEAELVRRGRTLATARSSFAQNGKTNLTSIAAFGDLGRCVGSTHEIELRPPEITPRDRCVQRDAEGQGVSLSILNRVDVLIDPKLAVPGESDQAVMEGWIRFADAAPPSALALPFFADAFPPPLYAKFGMVGWVPTIELTVHVRRQPNSEWLIGRFECDDLVNGRMIETGALWDETGQLVARSRQVGLLLEQPE